MNIVVMVSGSGSNLQAIIDAIENGGIPGSVITLVISSRSDAYALTRALGHGIPVFTAGKAEYPEESARTKAVLEALYKAEADLVVLAGYMQILPPEIIRAYRNRIINIHPALIPKYCGKGFYGIKVHQAVIDAGENESGATVHFVDEGVDTGQIILQVKVKVLPGDNAESLAARVLESEHRLLVKAVCKIASEKRPVG